MRKVVSNVYVSLDGVVGHPEKWSLAYFSKESAAYQTALLEQADVLFQGRLTYESFAQFWNAPSEDAYNNRMYEIPKLLLSRTTTEGAWNNTTVVSDDPLTAVDKARGEGDGLMLSYGFGPIARTLMAQGLLDEVHVWVNPVLAGGDARPEDLLWQPGAPKTGFELLETTRIDTGVTILRLGVQRQD